MRNSRKLLLLIIPLLFIFAGCDEEDGDPSGNTDVRGTWRAIVAFSDCTPASVCAQAGFSNGTTLNAVMVLTQDRNEIDGTYTYEGAGINADVSGTVGDTQMLLNGVATNPLGRVTVTLSGIVTDRIQASINHQVTLVDGRSATVTGIGIFTR